MGFNWCILTRFDAKMIHNDHLTESQLKAARMIAMGIDFSTIADELSINRSTLYRWRKAPLFHTEVSQLITTMKTETRKRVINDISEIKDIALETLLDVAQNDSSGSARVSAARVLTELVQRAEERIDESDIMRDQSSEIRSILSAIQRDGQKLITS